MFALCTTYPSFSHSTIPSIQHSPPSSYAHSPHAPLLELDMADLGDFSLDAPETMVPPAFQARLAQMEEEIRRSHKQLAWSNEQLAEVCTLVAILAVN